MKTAEELARIRAGLAIARLLISRGWTRGVYARDHYFAPVLAHDPRATCWCLTGACDAADPSGTLGLRRWLAEEIPSQLSGLIEWNDHPARTQQDVLDLFDRALAKVDKTTEGLAP
jgi:hypothetical protein